MSSRVFGVALVAVVAGSLIGLVMLGNFGISLAALRIATGVIFFLVALRLVLAQYAGDEPQPPLPEEPMAATLAITFPIVVTPYGIAAVIGLLASAADSARVWTILALAAGMMVINFGAMLGARRILRGVPLFVLQVLSSVLGVVQVALAIEITLAGIRELSPARG
jgi:multiple antibiotic resistance protein